MKGFNMLARAIVIGIGLAIMYPALIYNAIKSVYPKSELASLAYPGPTATPDERKAHAEEQQRRMQQDLAYRRELSKIVVIAATAFGVMAILGGSLVPVPAISAGLIAGGAISVGVGYFGDAMIIPNWWRLVSLLAGCLALAFVGYRQWREEWF